MKNLLLFPIDEDDQGKTDSAKPEAEKPKKKTTSKQQATKQSAKKEKSKDTATKRKKKTPSRKQRLFSESDVEPIRDVPTNENSEPVVSTPTVTDAVPNTNAPRDTVPEVVEFGGPPAVALPPIENQLIRASAGTGKTYQLTSRYLRLILLGAAPETILATTFTRKAAGEILDRIVTWLANASADAEGLKNLARAVEMPELTHQDCRRKLAQLTRQMHRLQIHTIDAFFMQMALSFSLELGMTPGWQILEEGGPESNTLRNEAIAGILRQETLEDLLVLVHQMSPKGEVKRSLDGMLRSRVNDAYRLFLESSPEAWDRLKVPPPLPDDELDEVMKAMNSYTMKGKKIPQAIAADVTRILNRDWRGFFETGPTLIRSINEGKTKYSNANIPPDLMELYKRFLPHLRAMILQSASAQTRATHRFLEKYHDNYRDVKENQRLYGFDEVTNLLAQQAQTNNLAQMSFRMDTGIDHLLLDEFQDTSIPQWRALSKLARRCTSGEPGRSFFCVGDVKQAIYGWRGGSSEIFDLLGEKLPRLTLSELKDSRRSSQIIINAVNETFEFLPTWNEDRLGRAQRAAKAWEFPKHTTHCRDLPGYFTIETSDESASSKDAQETSVFRRAAERVASISKQAKGRSIGILCRRNNKVAQMMNELQRLGVPASEEGGNYLTDSATVELVLSLLHLTDHPADTVTAYHLASSPWGEMLGLRVGACPEIEFEVSAQADDEETAEKKTYRPAAGIDPKAISKLVRKVRRQLLDDGFGNTLQAFAQGLRPLCNRREARRLTQLVEKAYEFQHRIETPTQLGYERQRRQSMRPTEFVRFIRETKVADPSNATIRVMTVHQAKGLEFDIVVLPDLLGPLVEGHDTFLHRRPSIDSEIDLVCRYMGRDTGRSFLPDEFLPLFDEFEDRKARDSFCVLYVAMTRAVHALHVFVPHGMQRARGSKGHAAYLLKDAFAGGEPLEPVTLIHEAGDKHWFMNLPTQKEVEVHVEPSTPQPRLAKPKAQRRGFETVAPSQIGANRYVRMGDRFTRTGDEAKDYGTLVHLWLSQITWDDNVPSKARLRELAEPFADRIKVTDAIKKFTAMLKTEPLSEIISEKNYRDDLQKSIGTQDDLQIEVRVEQPVVGREDNQIISGTIDRLILVRVGSKLVAAEIIDYKTDMDGDLTTEEQQKKEQRYETQMAAYRRVIATSLRVENVTSRLVFL